MLHYPQFGERGTETQDSETSLKSQVSLELNPTVPILHQILLALMLMGSDFIFLTRTSWPWWSRTRPSSGVCDRGTYLTTILVFLPRCVTTMNRVKTARRYWQKTTWTFQNWPEKMDASILDLIRYSHVVFTVSCSWVLHFAYRVCVHIDQAGSKESNRCKGYCVNFMRRPT